MKCEEVIKFLADKKVFVKNKGKEVQEKLFNIGFKWVDPEEKGVYKNRYFLFLYEDLKLTYMDIDEIEYFYEHRFEEISIEDILNIEIKPLPKTWEEYCKINPIKDYNSEPAFLALMKLHQLRDYYREGSKFPYAISRNGSYLYISNSKDKFLSFQTKEIADEFLFNFKDLILQAGDLI